MTHHPREHNKRTRQRHRVPRRPRRRTSARQRNQHRHDILIRLAPKVERIRMLGSAAIDLAWVAAGRLDASIILANKPWDVSAGVLIARESGALVPDIDGTQNSRVGPCVHRLFNHRSHEELASPGLYGSDHLLHHGRVNFGSRSAFAQYRVATVLVWTLVIEAEVDESGTARLDPPVFGRGYSGVCTGFAPP